MKNEIKNNELRECQAYVPASVKVIEITAQRVMCVSTGNGNESYDEGNTDGWWN